ncbi:hypothetical protein GCM10017687_90790 [Streptomyces echinatus]
MFIHSPLTGAAGLQGVRDVSVVYGDVDKLLRRAGARDMVGGVNSPPAAPRSLAARPDIRESPREPSRRQVLVLSRWVRRGAHATVARLRFECRPTEECVRYGGRRDAVTGISLTWQVGARVAEARAGRHGEILL